MKKKRKSTTVILVIILIAGLSLLVYPSFSNWWNSFHGARMVSSYDESVKDMDDKVKNEIWKSAIKYNEELYKNGQVMKMSKAQRKRYENELRVPDSPIMGSISIPKIRVNLPIYHGTSEIVLNNGVGHLDWSSLPTGGKNTHCVLSGHRGLPSARLFTDIDKLKKGDLFVLNVLDQTLTYEVDQIRIVLPKDTSDLMLAKDKDYCTLVTCTPYGINTHRLLVRGHRVSNIYDTRIRNEAVLMDPMIVAGAMAVIILLCIISIYLGRSRDRKMAKQKAEFLARYGGRNENE